MRIRVRRRLFPLLASILLIAIGMYTTTWGPTMIGRSEWALPYDLWGTLVAATRLAHLNLGGLYTQPTGLVSLPGAAVILVPCAAIISASGLSLQIPGPDNLHPAVWLLAGPYQIALCCVTLFAADALAEELGVPRWKRALLAAASAGALWSVSARWGHPEDAVAVGLLLYATLALSRSRTTLAGWLAGAAVCVQPLVLLALPVLLALLPWRRMGLFLLQAATPAAAAVGAAALANWDATYRAVTSQPNSPIINHPTAWTSLAPHMSGGNVAAGPARLATILLACCCALAIRRRWLGRPTAPGPWAAGPAGAAPGDGNRGDRVPAGGSTAGGSTAGAGPGDGISSAAARWPATLLAEVLWWAALTLALRSFFEPVMVSYYPWPPLAVALIPAAALGWPRLIAASALAGGLTAAAQGPSHDVWIWWAPLVAGLAVMLALASPRSMLTEHIRQSRHQPAIIELSCDVWPLTAAKHHTKAEERGRRGGFGAGSAKRGQCWGRGGKAAAARLPWRSVTAGVW